MAGDYSSGMEEKKRGRPREKMRAGTTRSGDYGSGMEEKKPRPKATQKAAARPAPRASAPFSSAVEGEAQAVSREAAKRQAARTAASTAGKGMLRGALRFAGPVGAAVTGYELGSALKDTAPARAAQRGIANFLSRRTEYKQEQADKAAQEAARKRGEAKRDAGKPNYMKQVSDAALKKYQDKQISDVSVTARKRAMPYSDVPKTKPAPAKPAAPKRDRMKEFMGSLSEDNAVLKKLRERGFKKGGKIDGVAARGRTKTRYI